MGIERTELGNSIEPINGTACVCANGRKISNGMINFFMILVLRSLGVVGSLESYTICVKHGILMMNIAYSKENHLSKP